MGVFLCNMHVLELLQHELHGLHLGQFHIQRLQDCHNSININYYNGWKVSFAPPTNNLFFNWDFIK